MSLVGVAPRTPSHSDRARQSLQANKHVVVEKPFTTTSGQAQELIDLARWQNKVISVNHNRRWDGDFQTVKKLLEGRLLGRLVEYESHYNRFRNYPRPNAWREEEGAGGGGVFDIGSHPINLGGGFFGGAQKN